MWGNPGDLICNYYSFCVTAIDSLGALLSAIQGLSVVYESGSSLPPRTKVHCANSDPSDDYNIYTWYNYKRSLVIVIQPVFYLTEYLFCLLVGLYVSHLSRKEILMSTRVVLSY